MSHACHAQTETYVRVPVKLPKRVSAGRQGSLVDAHEVQRHVMRKHLLGGNRRGVTPVPISNTVVKPSTADGTCPTQDWESMKLPGFI